MRVWGRLLLGALGGAAAAYLAELLRPRPPADYRVVPPQEQAQEPPEGGGPR